MGAVLADQTNAEHPNDAGSQQEGLDFHVDQPGKDTGRNSAVNGADDQVTRQASLHRNVGRLRIPDFAHHDHLRILAHQANAAPWRK